MPTLDWKVNKVRPRKTPSVIRLRIVSREYQKLHARIRRGLTELAKQGRCRRMQ